MIYRTNESFSVARCKAPSGRELAPKATEGARGTSLFALYNMAGAPPFVPRAPSVTLRVPPPSRREAYNAR